MATIKQLDKRVKYIEYLIKDKKNKPKSFKAKKKVNTYVFTVRGRNALKIFASNIVEAEKRLYTLYQISKRQIISCLTNGKIIK